MENKDTDGLDVTILMPVLNEAESLPLCIDNARVTLDLLAERGLSGEILISDNGSSDGSAGLAERLGARVVACPDRGYGRALKEGVESARGRIIVMADADGSYDFRESVPMIEKLLEGYDLCLGNRFKGKIEPGAMPFKNRYLGNPLLTSILNLLFKSGLGDAHCGLRAFTKEAFEKMRLSARGMEFASEMVVKAALLGLKRTELPVTLHKDLRSRPPNLKPWRDGWRHLKFLILASPLWLYLIPSLLLITISTLIFSILLLTSRAEVFSFGALWIGDHWFILAGGLFILGCNGLLLAMASLIISVKEGYRGLTSFTRRLNESISVERALLIGGMFMLIGVAFLLYVFLYWAAIGFGPMLKIREMVVGTTLLVVGVQVCFAGFFLTSMK